MMLEFRVGSRYHVVFWRSTAIIICICRAVENNCYRNYYASRFQNILLVNLGHTALLELTNSELL